MGATEVRSLAGRSAAAAKEIKTLIENSVVNVESGARLVADAGGTMDELAVQVRKVNDLMGAIATASKEQSLGIAQEGQAIAQLDEMTQQNAAMVEQSSASAIRMREQAQSLVRAVNVFLA